MLTIVHRNPKEGEAVIVGEGDDKKTVELKAGQILTDPAIAAAAIALGIAADRYVYAARKFYFPLKEGGVKAVNERSSIDDLDVALYALARPGFARVDPALPEGVDVQLVYPYKRKAEAPVAADAPQAGGESEDAPQAGGESEDAPRTRRSKF